MEHVGAISCTQCGSPVGTSSGRCPFCGAELSRAKVPTRKSEAAPVGYYQGSERNKKKGRRGQTKTSIGLLSTPVLVLIGIGGLLVVAGLVLSLLRGGGTDEVAAPPAPPPPPTPVPGEIRVASLSEFSPDDAVAAAQHRAREYSPNARLLSISASPVVGTFVDLNPDDAQVVFTYFAADGDSPSKNHRFIVTVGKQGAMQADFPSAPTDAKAVVEEPLCVFSAAIRAGRASGIPDDAPIHAVYELDTSLRRAVWKLTVPEQKDLTRYIDGNTCAIIANRR